MVALIASAETLLAVEGLTIRAQDTGRPLVDEVALEVAHGECLGLVGESGSGKTLTLRSLVGLLPPTLAWTAGEMRFAVQPGAAPAPYEPEHQRGIGIGMIFQDPARSLNPRWRVRQTLAEPLRRHLGRDGRELDERTLSLLSDVGIADPKRIVESYPHELSGGERQRVLIAAALACDPSVLLCDEPTTALDVTTQAQIIALLRKLASERGLAMVFVSHDLAVIAEIADRIAVMYAGQIVETGSSAQVLRAPRHPYTLGLVASVPRASGPRRRLVTIPGHPPGAGEPYAGCAFAPRCALAIEPCRAMSVPLYDAGPQHRARCLRWEAVAAAEEAHDGAA